MLTIQCDACEGKLYIEDPEEADRWAFRACPGCEMILCIDCQLDHGCLWSLDNPNWFSFEFRMKNYPLPPKEVNKHDKI